MARLPRLIVPLHAHHIMQRGNDRRNIFFDDADCQAFSAWLKDAAKRYGVAIHAYVLMPNHVHLLATPSDQLGLGRMMQWVGRYYVPYFNQKYNKVGTLWQGRFKASIVDSERYFMTCCRYIELNPVRAGISAVPLDFVWSSYAHHIGAKVDALITDHPLYWALGNTPFEREAAYREYVEQGLTNTELAELNNVILKGWTLGSADFKKELELQIKRRVGEAKRGRPRKAPIPE